MRALAHPARIAILDRLFDSGGPAILALAAAIGTMIATRSDLVSLAAGLGALTVIRALG